MAVAKGDLRAVADVAHRLKSGAGSIGALKLRERCTALELAAEAVQRSQVAALLASLLADLHEVSQALEGH